MTRLGVIAKRMQYGLFFLLLQEPAGNTLRRVLAAVAELSFGELTWSSSGARGALLSIYFCALSSLTEGQPCTDTSSQIPISSVII